MYRRCCLSSTPFNLVGEKFQELIAHKKLHCYCTLLFTCVRLLDTCSGLLGTVFFLGVSVLLLVSPFFSSWGGGGGYVLCNYISRAGDVFLFPRTVRSQQKVSFVDTRNHFSPGRGRGCFILPWVVPSPKFPGSLSLRPLFSGSRVSSPSTGLLHLWAVPGPGTPSLPAFLPLLYLPLFTGSRAERLLVVPPHSPGSGVSSP